MGLMGGCAGTALRGGRAQQVDSLNGVAYGLRYRNCERSRLVAEQALEAAGNYGAGRAEAYNHLGHCAFMQMDYEAAEHYYAQAVRLTRNELVRLSADVGLMQVRQLTAQNREFYLSRTSAWGRMKRIADDPSPFQDRRSQERLAWARTTFWVTSARYHQALEQDVMAEDCLLQLDEADLAADTALWLDAHCLLGQMALSTDDSGQGRKLRQMDELFRTWLAARATGYPYFERVSLAAMGRLMAQPTDYEFYLTHRPHLLAQLGLPADSLTPLALLRQALSSATEAGDFALAAHAYVSIATCLNAQGHYREAIDSLTRALEGYNRHHLLHYSSGSASPPSTQGNADLLQPYGRRDTLCTELLWMERGQFTVPEGIARIREQLSVAYAGLEQKEYSDYNRNAYLDLLDETRQDREWESRTLTLEAETRQLNTVLITLTLCMVVWMTLFVGLGRWARRREREYTGQLEQVADICQRITRCVTAEVLTKQEMNERIEQAVKQPLSRLLATDRISVVDGRLQLPPGLSRQRRAMAKLVQPYITWALGSGLALSQLIEEREQLESKRYVHERHIAQGKRDNMLKKTCMAVVSGIRPYMDRLAHLMRSLAPDGPAWPDVGRRQELYSYAGELVDVINEHNEILAHWIQLKQGALSLNVENFPMSELFDLLRKGEKSFAMKGIILNVEPTEVYVKADKALTMFMVNTLADNARKYTPEGGRVSISARQEGQVVEVSVSDTGCGLSPDEASRLMGRAGAVQQGRGFGLMNCKGIIEKYRKTDPLFSVCKLGVESEKGRGSRFYFHLPAGVRRAWIVAGLMLGLSAGLSGCAGEATGEADTQGEEQGVTAFEALLDSASLYANAAYYCNLDGQYDFALQYIDSALLCLNDHYECYGCGTDTMVLVGDGPAAELYWWDEPYNTDFHVVLDVRNEAAVACLALKRWSAYTYNNNAYTALYKLLGEDRSLEDYCRQLQRSASNKMVGIYLCIALLLFSLLEFYLIYIRRRLAIRWRLEQVFEANSRVLESSIPESFSSHVATIPEPTTSVATTEEILQHIVGATFDAVNALMPIQRLGIAVSDETLQGLAFAAFPKDDDDSDEGGQAWRALARKCHRQQVAIHEGVVQACPLVAEADDVVTGIGSLCLVRVPGTERDDDPMMLGLLAHCMGMVARHAAQLRSGQCRSIEQARDEVSRVAREDSLIHVQNMVLDNCLSTIKHETVYYPSRIRLLIERLRTDTLAETEELQTLIDINELIAYYQGLYTLLSRCAEKQVEQVTFRRRAVAVTSLLDEATRYFCKVCRGRTGLTLTTRNSLQTTETYPAALLPAEVMGDSILLRFLFECLIDEALMIDRPGTLCLEAVGDGDFVRFNLTDSRQQLTQVQLNELFYPQLSRSHNYLVCKQIIREHDHYAGRRGCRMGAEQAGSGQGITVFFTLFRTPCKS